MELRTSFKRQDVLIQFSKETESNTKSFPLPEFVARELFPKAKPMKRIRVPVRPTE
jgi:hypothetical protein